MPDEARHGERSIPPTKEILSYVEQAKSAILAELGPTEAQLKHGLELHRDSLVCDMMGDPGGTAPWYLFSDAMAEWALARLSEATNVDDRRRVAEDMTADLRTWRVFELANDPQLRADHRLLWDVRGVTLGVCSEVWTTGMIAALNYLFDRSDSMEKVVSLEGLHRLKSEGKQGYIWYSHDRPIIDESKDHLENLDLAYVAGVRWCQVASRGMNELASGHMGDPTAGLTDLGREVVTRMNELGMMADGSHSSPQTVLDMARVSSDPVTFIHGACRSVSHGYSPHRNITDEAMKAVADTGGVIGISPLPRLSGGYTIEQFLAHIDHAVRLVGVDHVSLCSDYTLEYALAPPELLDAIRPAEWDVDPIRKQSQEFWDFSVRPHPLSISNWPYITSVALVCHGYSDEDISKMLGENVLRVAAPILARTPNGSDVKLTIRTPEPPPLLV